MLLIMTKISNSSRFYDLPLLPTSSLSNPDCFYSQCLVHLNSALVTASPLWSSALVQLSYIVCSCACHVLLPPVTYTMPLTQLITALTYFTILFTSSNYYWSQLRVYWGEAWVRPVIFLICVLLRCLFCFLNALELLWNVLFGVLNLFLVPEGRKQVIHLFCFLHNISGCLVQATSWLASSLGKCSGYTDLFEISLHNTKRGYCRSWGDLGPLENPKARVFIMCTECVIVELLPMPCPYF